MKIKSSILRKLVKEVLSEVNIVKFNQDEMGELHKGGQIEKNGVFYQYEQKPKKIN